MRLPSELTSSQTPLSTLLSPPDSPNLQSKLFLTDDAALVVLYKQLREKSLQTLRGAVMVSPRAEWEFVLHTARLYERMGCDLLALDLGLSTSHLRPLHLASLPSTSMTRANNYYVQSEHGSSLPRQLLLNHYLPFRPLYLNTPLIHYTIRNRPAHLSIRSISIPGRSYVGGAHLLWLTYPAKISSRLRWLTA